MKMIYLLRHGQTEPLKEKTFVGQTDIPLSQSGAAQARLWRKRLGASFERIFCSDLARSSDTARIIAGDETERIRIMPRLREIHLGEWEMRPMSEIRTRFPDEWHGRGENMPSYRPPGGESFADLHKRVVPVFEDIAASAHCDTLIVGHAGVNRIILCHVLGMPLGNLFRLAQDHAGLNLIDCEKEPFQVLVMNRQVWDGPSPP